MDWLHRIMTGQAITPAELRVGGFLVILWFTMDLIQWLDWLWSKLH